LPSPPHQGWLTTVELESEKFDKSQVAQDTYDVGAASARESRKLVVRLSHLHVALDVRSGQSVLSVRKRMLLLITVENMLGCGKGINTASRIGAVCAAEVVGRQRVPMHAKPFVSYSPVKSIGPGKSNYQVRTKERANLRRTGANGGGVIHDMVLLLRVAARGGKRVTDKTIHGSLVRRSLR